MNCSQRSHLPRPGREYAQPAPLARRAILCDQCRDKLEALGMDWRLVEEPFVAPWRARLTSRDETGRNAA